jgi:hypothetical protein
MRDDVDPVALSAWFAGTSFTRVIADFGGAKVSDEAWNHVAELAFISIAFGDDHASSSTENKVA